MIALDVNAVEAQLLTGACRLPAGDYAAARQVNLPKDRGVLFAGDGPCITSLYCRGKHGIVSEVRDKAYGPAIVKGMAVYATENLEDGVRIVRDWGVRAHEPQVILEDVHCSPAPGLHDKAAWRRSFVVDRAWSAKIHRCSAVGNFNGVPYKAVKTGHAEVGFEVGGSQEAKITDCYVACMKVGAHVAAPEAGCGEGFGLDKSTFIHCLTCVLIEGSAAGTWGPFATPYATLSKNHLFFLEHAIKMTDRYSADIEANDICASHLAPNSASQMPYAIFVAGNSGNVKIRGNNFYSAKHGQGCAVLVDASNHGLIQGNTIDASMAIGVLFNPQNGSVSGWDVRANVNVAAPWPMLDFGKGNRVEAA